MINEDNNWSGGSLSVNAFPGRQITWTIIEKPQFGEFLYQETQNGTIEGITYAPQANFYGMDSLVIQASDGFSNDLYSFKFRVLSVVDKPEFISFTDSLFIEDRDNLNLTISFLMGMEWKTYHILLKLFLVGLQKICLIWVWENSLNWSPWGQ